METKLAVEDPSRTALWSGAGYAVISILASVLFVVTIGRNLPALDAPASDYLELYAQNAMMTGVLLYLAVVAAVAFIPAISFLAVRAAEVTGVRQTAVTIALAALLMLALPLGANIVEAYFGTTLAASGESAESIKAIDGVLPVANAAAALARGLLLAVLAQVILRGVGQRWLGIAGLVLAVVSAVASLTVLIPVLFPLVLISSILFWIWLVLVLLAWTRTAPLASSGGSLAAA